MLSDTAKLMDWTSTLTWRCGYADTGADTTLMALAIALVLALTLPRRVGLIVPAFTGYIQTL